MTLDEAIKICEEDAKLTWNGKPTVAAEECQQMVEWLKDYKRLLGAIDDIRAEIQAMIDDISWTNTFYKAGQEVALRDVLEIIDRYISREEQE